MPANLYWEWLNLTLVVVEEEKGQGKLYGHLDAYYASGFGPSPPERSSFYEMSEPDMSRYLEIEMNRLKDLVERKR